MDTAALIVELISRLANLGLQLFAAQAASDQAALDAIHAQAVAASNAMTPPGGEAPVVVI